MPRVMCRHCYAKFQVPARDIGEPVSCPECKLRFVAWEDGPAGSSEGASSESEPIRAEVVRDPVPERREEISERRRDVPAVESRDDGPSRRDDRPSRRESRPVDDDRFRPKKKSKVGLIVTLLIVFFLLGGLAIGGLVIFAYYAINKPIAAGDWKEFVAPDKRFKVSLPGVPKVKSEFNPLQGDKTEVYIVDLGTKAFVMSYVDLPRGQWNRDEIEALFDERRDDIVQKEAHSKLISDTKLTHEGNPCREIVIAIPGQGQHVVRLIFARPRMYVLVASNSLSYTADSPDVKQFFGSFTTKMGDVTPTKFTRPAKSEVPVTYMHIESPAGDFVGAGKTIDLTDAKEIESRLQDEWVFVNAGSWHLGVAGPGGANLQPGEYLNATRATLDFGGDGRGCNSISGEFVVWEVEFGEHQVTRLAVDFVQRCEGTQPPLKGRVRINSSYK